MDNSKLDPLEKAWLLEQIKENPEWIFGFSGVVTYVAKTIPHEYNDLWYMATARCGNNEKKFRPTVGMFHAVDRLTSGSGVEVNTLPNIEWVWFSEIEKLSQFRGYAYGG